MNDKLYCPVCATPTTTLHYDRDGDYVSCGCRKKYRCVWCGMIEAYEKDGECVKCEMMKQNCTNCFNVSQTMHLVHTNEPKEKLYRYDCTNGKLHNATFDEAKIHSCEYYIRA